MKFRSDVAGFITALRFYKALSSTGTHTGSLWTSSGTLLERVTFTNETASGWQQVTLPTPAAITANTVYVASYFVPAAGRYSATENAFTSAGVDNPPLHALANTVSVNGVYRYGSSSGFPTSSFSSTNYWVDVVFTTTATDTTPPTVTTTAPANAATGVATNANVTATFSEVMTPSSLTTTTFLLRTGGAGQSGTLVAASVTYNATTRVATLNPTPANLAAGTYTATLLASGVKDLAGNALAADVTWSFTMGTAATTTTSTTTTTTTTTTAPTTTTTSTTTTAPTATTTSTTTTTAPTATTTSTTTTTAPTATTTSTTTTTAHDHHHVVDHHYFPTVGVLHHLEPDRDARGTIDERRERGRVGG